MDDAKSCNIAHLDGSTLNEVTKLLSSCADIFLNIEIKTNSQKNHSCKESIRQFIAVKNKKSYLNEFCSTPSFFYLVLCQIHRETSIDVPAIEVAKSFNPWWIVLAFAILFLLCCVWKKRTDVSMLKFIC